MTYPTDDDIPLIFLGSPHLMHHQRPHHALNQTGTAARSSQQAMQLFIVVPPGEGLPSSTAADIPTATYQQQHTNSNQVRIAIHVSTTPTSATSQAAKPSDNTA
jgi:hypothetical protein